MRLIFTRLLRWCLVILVFGMVAGGIVLQYSYNNEALAKRLAERFNRDRRGRIEIRRVHWSPHAIWALVTGGSTRITVTGLRLRDSRGVVALETPTVELEVRPRELFGSRRFTFRSLRAQKGLIALDRYLRPDGPSPAGSAEEVGLLGALEPRPRMGRSPSRTRPAAPARRPASTRVLTLSELWLSGISLRLSQGRDRAQLEALTLRGRLRHASGGRHALTLDLSATAPRGTLRARQREVPLSSLSLACRSIPDAGTLGVKGALAIDGAPVTLVGRVEGIPVRRHPNLSLTVQAARFGSVLGRLLARPVREEGSRLVLTAEGTTAAVTAKAKLSGLGWDTAPDAPSLSTATVSYSAGQILLESALIRAWGGRIQTTGWLARETGRWGVDAQLDSVNAPWLLRRHLQEVDLQASGLAHGVGSLGEARQTRGFLSLLATRRSEEAPMPQVVTLVGSFTGSRRLLQMDRVIAWSDLGILRTSGQVRIPEGHLELEVHLETWKLRAHLQTFGLRPSLDGVDLVGRLSGPALNPVFDGTLGLHDVRYQLLRIALLRSPATFTEGTLVADPLRSPHYGRHLSAALRITLYKGSFRNFERPTLTLTWGIGRR